MTRVLLFDGSKIERQELEDNTSNERYQFAINELKNINKRYIRVVCRCKKTAGGYKWKYVKDFNR